MPDKPKITLTTWYFEMLAPPARPLHDLPPGLSIVLARKPPVHFYRYLYDTIGGPWVWWERKRQSDARVLEDIHHPEVDLFVPYLDGVPIGMIELDRRDFPEVKLPYFGIVPEYCGRGIGAAALDWSIAHVWGLGAKRYWLTTCSLDSPAALRVYESAGFARFKQEDELVDDPALG